MELMQMGVNFNLKFVKVSRNSFRFKLFRFTFKSHVGVARIKWKANNFEVKITGSLHCNVCPITQTSTLIWSKPYNLETFEQYITTSWWHWATFDQIVLGADLFDDTNYFPGLSPLYYISHQPPRLSQRITAYLTGSHLARRVVFETLF